MKTEETKKTLQRCFPKVNVEGLLFLAFLFENNSCSITEQGPGELLGSKKAMQILNRKTEQVIKDDQDIEVITRPHPGRLTLSPKFPTLLCIHAFRYLTHETLYFLLL